jgi:poly(hydroxyalkanoate) depolymerase family esterase
MKLLFSRDMVEATRLTRAGRLNEAMALLQGMLRGNQPSAPPTAIALPAPVLELKPVADRRFSDEPAVSAGILPTHGAFDGIFNRLQLNGLGLKGLGLRGVPGRPAPPASAIAPTAGQFITKSFSNEAGRRAYKLYSPSRYGDEPRPLIVMLHGCTQSADDFAAGTRMNFAAEEHACFVVYPEQPVSANASKCWNWFKGSDQQRGRGEPALIAGITRQVMRDHRVDARRVYIAGLSAGGAAATIMGEAYPDLYAAVGVHSGLACGAARDLPTAFAAMRGDDPLHASMSRKPGERALPTIVFHGDRDTTVHPRNSAEVIARANAGSPSDASVDRGSVSGRRYTRSIQRDANGRSVLEHWEIHGAGHAWSGGNAAGSFTDPTGPDATQEMLRFFLEHAR